MAEQPMGSIRIHFSKLEDPQIERRKLHQLQDMIAITGANMGRYIELRQGTDRMVPEISGTTLLDPVA